MNEKKITVKIGKEQFEKVQREREITKVPQIHIINEAIDQYLENKSIFSVGTSANGSFYSD